MNDRNKSLGDSDIPRRRGRPAGKNRVPLSREERRARNAEYERQRRNETAEVMSQLAEAADCNPNIANADLLATVISRIQRASRNNSEDITDLKRLNANLEAQIATLQERLGLDDEAVELLLADDAASESAEPHSNKEKHSSKKQRKKRKRSDRLSSEGIRPDKRSKTNSETCSVDSGIGMRGHTVSPPPLCDHKNIHQNNVQYLEQTESQLPLEMSEELDTEHCESQAYVEMQTELYNQIYNSDSLTSVESISAESVSKCITSLSAQSQAIPSIEKLTRSLFVVPSIVPPQHVSPDCQEVTQSESADLEFVELPSEFNSVDDFLHQSLDQELTLDFLTDSDRALLSDVWIGADFLQSSDRAASQVQVRNYPGDDMLTRY